jgi:hypothetical protein
MSPLESDPGKLAARSQQQALRVLQGGKAKQPKALQDMSLGELFKEADRVGNKYQSKDDPIDLGAKREAAKILDETGFTKLKNKAMGVATIGKAKTTSTPIEGGGKRAEIASKLKGQEMKLKGQLSKLASQNEYGQWVANDPKDSAKASEIEKQMLKKRDLHDRATKSFDYAPPEEKARWEAVSAARSKMANKQKVKEGIAAKKKETKDRNAAIHLLNQRKAQEPKRLKQELGVKSALIGVDDKNIQTNLGRRLEEAQRRGPLTGKALDRVFSTVGGSDKYRDTVTASLNKGGYVSPEKDVSTHVAALVKTTGNPFLL